MRAVAPVPPRAIRAMASHGQAQADRRCARRCACRTAPAIAFADRDRLQRALTHASARSADAGADYERLEFLGDRVLGLVVADMLLSAFPKRAGRASCRCGSMRWSMPRRWPRSPTDIGLPELIRAGSDVRGARGAQARQSARRRAGIADRRALSRRRARGCPRLHPCAIGSRVRSALAPRAATPRPSCRNGRIRRRRRVPAYQIERPRRPRPRSAVHGQRQGGRLRAGNRQSAAPSARPSKPRRRRSCCAKGCGSDERMTDMRRRRRKPAATPLRLRRADRRAQRRQVDAGQPAGRRQGVDRHPQGADDPRHRARHRHARRTRRSSSSTRPASSSRSAGSTRRW